jgi:NADH-quinone oxidoreductase subunit E
MPRLTAANEAIAHEILGRYPVPKSALVPLLHLAQEQDGYVTDDAIEHLAELVGCTPAEVLGTCSFYEMLKLEEVGRYAVNICTDISCMLLGADQLLHHAEQKLGVRSGQTTPDGQFTLEGVTCIAACTEAPCLQVNYRYEYRVGAPEFDQLVDDLAAGRKQVPPHGTLSRVRQHIPDDSAAGNADPAVNVEPAWMRTADADGASSGGGS